MNFEQYSKDLLSPNKNIQFSKLNKLDLKQLLSLVNNYNLTYRKNLFFNQKVAFGCEIEYERILKLFTDKFIKNNLPSWNSKNDASCNIGGEITTPKIHNTISNWIEIEKACKFLKSKESDTFHNAAIHVHVQREVVEDLKNNILFLKLYASYEHVLFRFGYGDKLNARKNILRYALPVADFIYEVLDDMNIWEVKYASFPQSDRYCALNYLTGDKKTIECRMFNSTNSEIIVQNYINAFLCTVLAPQTGQLDEEFIDYKLKNEFISPMKEWYKYSEIVLKNSLEFVDLVFNNNLDKIYFLVQYIKHFESAYGSKKLIKAKSFIKQ